MKTKIRENETLSKKTQFISPVFFRLSHFRFLKFEFKESFMYCPHFTTFLTLEVHLPTAGIEITRDFFRQKDAVHRLLIRLTF